MKEDENEVSFSGSGSGHPRFQIVIAGGYWILVDTGKRHTGSWILVIVKRHQ